MGPRRLRIRVLLDEGLPPRQSFPKLNAIANLVHVKHDLKRPGAPDHELYALATEDGRVVVTLNLRDFKRLVRSDGASVIGVGPAMFPKEIDTKVVALLRRLKPHHLKDHFFKIDRETRVTDLL